MDTVSKIGLLITMEELVRCDSAFFSYRKEDVEEGEVLSSSSFVSKLLTEGYLVVPGPPRYINLVGLRSYFASHFDATENFWYESMAFANRELLRLRCLAIATNPVSNSFGASWDGSVQLLQQKEKVPTILEMVYASIAVRLLGGEIFPQGVSLRTGSRSSTIDGQEAHASLYSQAGSGLSVRSVRDSNRSLGIGMVKARLL